MVMMEQVPVHQSHGARDITHAQQRRRLLFKRLEDRDACRCDTGETWGSFTDHADLVCLSSLKSIRTEVHRANSTGMMSIQKHLISVWTVKWREHAHSETSILNHNWTLSWCNLKNLFCKGSLHVKLKQPLKHLLLTERDVTAQPCLCLITWSRTWEEDDPCRCGTNCALI